MGKHVRILLWQDERLQAIGWPLDIGWVESGVWASLTRGELVIRTEVTWREWWLPQTRSRAREWARRLAEVLVRTQEKFAGADETGRRSVCAWQSADGRIEWEKPEDGARSEPIEFVFEPGVFLSEQMGGSRPLVHRLDDAAGIFPQRGDRARMDGGRQCASASED